MMTTAGMGASKGRAPLPAGSGRFSVVAPQVRRIPSGSQPRIRFSR